MEAIAFLGVLTGGSVGLYFLYRMEWPLPDFIYISASMFLLGTGYGLGTLFIQISCRLAEKRRRWAESEITTTSVAEPSAES